MNTSMMNTQTHDQLAFHLYTLVHTYLYKSRVVARVPANCYGILKSDWLILVRRVRIDTIPPGHTWLEDTS